MVIRNLYYVVVPSWGVADEWRVEAIDYEGEGECFVAIFCGMLAEERAGEYADFKNARGRIVA